MLTLNWRTCGKDGHWCDLVNLDLSENTDSGVYIIWHEGNPGRVVRIGKGKISERLEEHRNDPEIMDYAEFGRLRVTWAQVPRVRRERVERYLADQLDPLVGERFPDVEPIAVNLPW